MVALVFIGECLDVLSRSTDFEIIFGLCALDQGSALSSCNDASRVSACVAL